MIVLLTDFGQSEYAGVMKGVIYSIDPDAKVVDLCHDVAPQSIIEASWILKNNYKYFPTRLDSAKREETVFCCVVDPGVGTKRKALAIKAEDYYFIAPDNGLLWETLSEQKILDIREIPIPAEASKTFHGRDVFAKAAAKSNQDSFETIGKKTEIIEKLNFYLNDRAGMIVRIDRFGNIVTNLTKQDKDRYTVAVEENKYNMQYYRNYDSAKEGELFLIEGSNNTLEISLKNTSANDKLHVKAGQKVTIS